MEAVHNFATSLHTLWVKINQKYVITLKDVKIKLIKKLKIYATKILKAEGNKI